MIRWIFALFLFLNSATGWSVSQDTTVATEEKYYVQPDQVMITDAGIWVYAMDELYQVPQLNADENGLYVLKGGLNRKCAWHWHFPRCFYCGGCFISGCPYQCMCPPDHDFHD